MSIGSKIIIAFNNEIDDVKVDKSVDVHGETATEIVVYLTDGRTVTGTFTTQPRSGFGGVESSGHKDMADLMILKTKSVLKGTAE